MADNSQWYQVKGFPNYEVSTTYVVRNIETKEVAPFVYMGGNFIELENDEGGKSYVPAEDVKELLKFASDGVAQ